MMTMKCLLGFSMSFIVLSNGLANQVNPGYSGTFPVFLNSREKWESGEPSKVTTLIETILNEDWNNVNSNIFNGQILEISGAFKKTKKIKIINDPDRNQSIAAVEKLIDTYTTHVNTTKQSEEESTELSKWADEALGEKNGFKSSLKDLKKLVIGNGHQQPCFYNCTKSYNGSIFHDIAKSNARYVLYSKIIINNSF